MNSRVAGLAILFLACLLGCGDTDRKLDPDADNTKVEAKSPDSAPSKQKAKKNKTSADQGPVPKKVNRKTAPREPKPAQPRPQINPNAGKKLPPPEDSPPKKKRVNTDG